MLRLGAVDRRNERGFSCVVAQVACGALRRQQGGERARVPPTRRAVQRGVALRELREWAGWVCCLIS